MYTFYTYSCNFIFHNKNNSRVIIVEYNFSEIRKIIKDIIKISC